MNEAREANECEKITTDENVSYGTLNEDQNNGKSDVSKFQIINIRQKKKNKKK